MIEAFIEGANEIGVPRTDDFNGARQEGAGYYQLNTHRGWRCSAAKAYLSPAKSRSNLRIECNAHATRVLFEGTRAVGVTYMQHGVERTIRCTREVLLAAGALQTPQLLQLSGVGPAALLSELGIPIVAAIEGVGENLQDHLQFRLQYECTKPITTNDELNSLFGRMKIGLQWLFRRSGPLAIGINQGGCFMRALRDADIDPVERARPDIQFHVATLSADMAGGKVHPFSGFTMSVCQLRPTSHGSVLVKSRDPAEPPALRPNYLATEFDQQTMVAGLKVARSIAHSAPMRDYTLDEYKPGAAVATDDDLLDFIRGNGATIFHPAGTCKMGTDPMAVVDPQLRVRGIDALRVIDCSVMPTIVSGNTNWPVVMIAEKAADLMLRGQ